MVSVEETPVCLARRATAGLGAHWPADGKAAFYRGCSQPGFGGYFGPHFPFMFQVDAERTGEVARFISWHPLASLGVARAVMWWCSQGWDVFLHSAVGADRQPVGPATSPPC